MLVTSMDIRTDLADLPTVAELRVLYQDLFEHVSETRGAIAQAGAPKHVGRKKVTSETHVSQARSRIGHLLEALIGPFPSTPLGWEALRAHGTPLHVAESAERLWQLPMLYKDLQASWYKGAIATLQAINDRNLQMHVPEIAAVTGMEMGRSTKEILEGCRRVSGALADAVTPLLAQNQRHRAFRAEALLRAVVPEIGGLPFAERAATTLWLIGLETTKQVAIARLDERFDQAMTVLKSTWPDAVDGLLGTDVPPHGAPHAQTYVVPRRIAVIALADELRRSGPAITPHVAALVGWIRKWDYKRTDRLVVDPKAVDSFAPQERGLLRCAFMASDDLRSGLIGREHLNTLGMGAAELVTQCHLESQGPIAVGGQVPVFAGP